MLPLPDLAGNAVLVWYSMLSHNLWWRGSTSYHGTPKLSVIHHPTWSSDSLLRCGLLHDDTVPSTMGFTWCYCILPVPCRVLCSSYAIGIACAIGNRYFNSEVCALFNRRNWPTFESALGLSLKCTFPPVSHKKSITLAIGAWTNRLLVLINTRVN